MQKETRERDKLAEDKRSWLRETLDGIYSFSSNQLQVSFQSCRKSGVANNFVNIFAFCSFVLIN